MNKYLVTAAIVIGGLALGVAVKGYMDVRTPAAATAATN